MQFAGQIVADRQDALFLAQGDEHVLEAAEDVGIFIGRHHLDRDVVDLPALDQPHVVDQPPCRPRHLLRGQQRHDDDAGQADRHHAAGP